MAFKVVKTFAYPAPTTDEAPLQEMGIELVKIPCRTEADLINAAHDADAVIGQVTQPFSRKVIERLKQCRVIAFQAAGYEGMDVAAATEHGICFSRASNYGAEEASDHAMALILACARKLFPMMSAVKAGKWEPSAEKPQIRRMYPGISRLRGQTLGIVGLGSIGRNLVGKARGYGLKVIAYSPHVPTAVAKEMGMEMVELDRLLKESDFVSLHTRGIAENRKMMGLEQFKKMKPTAYLINTARGMLVDEEALYTALREGYIAGAGLDVTDPEPPRMDSPLLALDNVIITPHMAAISEQSGVELRQFPIHEVVRVLKGEWPVGFVNPEVKERYMSKWAA